MILYFNTQEGVSEKKTLNLVDFSCTKLYQIHSKYKYEREQEKLHRKNIQLPMEQEMIGNPIFKTGSHPSVLLMQILLETRARFARA